MFEYVNSALIDNSTESDFFGQDDSVVPRRSNSSTFLPVWVLQKKYQKSISYGLDEPLKASSHTQIVL